MTSTLLVPSDTHPSRIGHASARFVAQHRSGMFPTYYAVIRSHRGKVTRFEFATKTGWTQAIGLVRKRSK